MATSPFIRVEDLSPVGPYNGDEEREYQTRRARTRLAKNFYSLLRPAHIRQLTAERERMVQVVPRAQKMLGDVDSRAGAEAIHAAYDSYSGEAWYLNIVELALDQLRTITVVDRSIGVAIRELQSVHARAVRDPALYGREVGAAAAAVIALNSPWQTASTELASRMLPLRLLYNKDDLSDRRDAIDAAVESALAGTKAVSDSSSLRARALNPVYQRVAESLLAGDDLDALDLLQDVTELQIDGAADGQSGLADALAAYNAYEVSLVEVCVAADDLWAGWDLEGICGHEARR